MVFSFELARTEGELPFAGQILHFVQDDDRDVGGIAQRGWIPAPAFAGVTIGRRNDKVLSGAMRARANWRLLTIRGQMSRLRCAALDMTNCPTDHPGDCHGPRRGPRNDTSVGGGFVDGVGRVGYARVGGSRRVGAADGGRFDTLG